MAAVAMHHFSGPSAPFVRSKGTVSGGVFMSEGALTRDMVTDYVKEVKIYGADDYRITWKYPELFEEMRRKADKNTPGNETNPQFGH